MRSFLVLLFLSSAACAQQYNDDAQLRTNIGLEKRITKKFSITLDQQCRFNQNMMTFNRASFDLGLNWKVNKWLKLKADYVFIEKKNRYLYFTERNWYYIAAVVKYETGKWKFFYRNLAQARQGPFNDEESHIVRYYDRNKVTLRYELTRRLSLWTAGEIYIPLNSPQTKGIERYRAFLGSTFKTAKRQSLEAYFMLQQFLMRNKWFDQSYRYFNGSMRRDFIYGIGYNIEF